LGNTGFVAGLNQSRLDKFAFAQFAFDFFTAGNDAAAFLFADFDVFQNGLELTSIDLRTHLGIVFPRQSDFDLFELFRQGADEFVVNAFLYKNARTGAAHLTFVEQNAFLRAFEGFVERHVVKEDIGGFATQLQGGWADLRLSLWHIGAHYWTYYGRAGTHALRPHSEDGGRLQIQLTPFSSLGSTLLYLDAYRSDSQRSGEDMAYSSVSYGLMTSLQIEREASLRLHYRGRKDSHRFKLEGAYDLGAWQPRLALLYARGAASSGWAVQGRLRWAPSERLQLDLLADAFDASSWDSRLYTLTPMLRGEYGATLLYGKGAVLGGRVRYHLSSHWQIEGRVQHEHQQRDVRPTKTLFALSLRYRGW